MKNSAGKWLTGALFIECVTPSNREHCIYTLKDEDVVVDGKDYISLKQRFLEEADDPTEYTFAKKYLGGWSHWKKLCESQQLQDYIQEWREERDVMLRSKGVQSLVVMAKGDEASYQAAKWLAEKGWEAPKGKGRPTKKQVNQEAKELAKARARAKNDLARLTGGKS